jgi:hypothetical protein
MNAHRKMPARTPDRIPHPDRMDAVERRLWKRLLNTDDAVEISRRSLAAYKWVNANLIKMKPVLQKLANDHGKFMAIYEQERSFYETIPSAFADELRNLEDAKVKLTTNLSLMSHFIERLERVQIPLFHLLNDSSDRVEMAASTANPLVKQRKVTVRYEITFNQETGRYTLAHTDKLGTSELEISPKATGGQHKGPIEEES